ncbi:transglutaminase [Labrys miyagiensis]|uniref:Transglutaminase n=1 Tax=Labrys miyagiensis TaxID=346912 RepID=A0ABQ6CHN1_9HYPH|nr:transglutaminase family protein [Labrys miyagiensis]GLS19768.1 transglutaminase [Labrys miyagiensis]
MHIRYGYTIEIETAQPTTLLTALDVEAARRRDIVFEHPFLVSGPARVDGFTDPYGNRCRRIAIGAGVTQLSCHGVIADSGQPDVSAPDAPLVPVAALPTDTLPFLLASRYCETDLLAPFAWWKFGGIEGGWAKVQAICDFVHDRVTFGYETARATRTAMETFEECVGVCRDFTHLAVTLCRCLNIPARYCNGYLGDIGVPPDPAPMDFNAWFEAYLGGRWYTFDARHNVPRIGRILVARGRDAMDIPMLQSFGPHILRRFEVTTEEVPDFNYAVAAE